MVTVVERFWAKVDKSGGHDACWPWMACRQKQGYGLFQYGGRLQGAHVVACQLHSGEPPRGFCTLHRCDSPSCCNPAHLYLGTTQENTADKMAKGRHITLQGESSPSARLTETQVREARRRHIPYSKENSSTALARKFGVSRPHMSDVLHGKRWSQIT